MTTNLNIYNAQGRGRRRTGLSANVSGSDCDFRPEHVAIGGPRATQD